jgi:FkbM family methyltransferase
MPYYERQMLPFIKLESDNVFIDVGAHIGKYTIYAARKCKIVIAIEPDPINFRVLLSNIRLNNLQNVIALNIAAYDKEDKIRLYTAEGSLGASIKINRDLGYTEVDAKPLDTVLEVLGVNKVDLVKIDVERSECEVLKGMKRILIEWHPRLIIEVWNENWSSIKDFLCELGYGIKEIEGMKSHEAFYVYCSRK